MNKLFKQRFEKLNLEADKIEKTKEYSSGMYSKGDFIDNHLLLKWKVQVQDLLLKICGEESQYFRQFQKAEEVVMGMTNYDTFKDLQSVFLAAKEDFEGGYLSSIKTLVQAEVFDSELEQAKELLNTGYLSAAAVIAGVVLETALRELCDRENIPHGKLDKMNADLAKAGKYNKLMQKRITALADIRNSAAHGNFNQFTQQDVENMMNEVEQFLAHLTD